MRIIAGPLDAGCKLVMHGLARCTLFLPFPVSCPTMMSPLLELTVPEEGKVVRKRFLSAKYPFDTKQ